MDMKPYKLNLLHQCVACAGGCVYRKRHFVAVMNVGCLPNQARVEMSSEDQSLCSGVTTKPKPRYPRPDQTKNRIGGKLGILERNHVRVVRERFETTPIAEPFGPKVAKCSIVEHSQAVSEPDEGQAQPANSAYRKRVIPAKRRQHPELSPADSRTSNGDYEDYEVLSADTSTAENTIPSAQASEERRILGIGRATGGQRPPRLSRGKLTNQRNEAGLAAPQPIPSAGQEGDQNDLHATLYVRAPEGHSYCAKEYEDFVHVLPPPPHDCPAEAELTACDEEAYSCIPVHGRSIPALSTTEERQICDAYCHRVVISARSQPLSQQEILATTDEEEAYEALLLQKEQPMSQVLRSRSLRQPTTERKKTDDEEQPDRVCFVQPRRSRCLRQRNIRQNGGIERRFQLGFPAAPGFEPLSHTSDEHLSRTTSSSSLCNHIHPGKDCSEPPLIVVRLSLLLSRDHDMELVNYEDAKLFFKTLVGEVAARRIDSILGTRLDYCQGTSDRRADIFDEVMTLYASDNGYKAGFDLTLKEILTNCRMDKLVDVLFD